MTRRSALVFAAIAWFCFAIEVIVVRQAANIAITGFTAILGCVALAIAFRAKSPPDDSAGTPDR